MIVDLERFITTERPYWEELEAALGRVETQLDKPMRMDELRRFHYLYERTSADLVKLNVVIDGTGTVWVDEVKLARSAP